MKILLCFALHIYNGPIEPGTTVAVVSEECKAVTLEKARRAIEKCTKVNDATKCEAIVSADHKRITIEQKISASVKGETK